MLKQFIYGVILLNFIFGANAAELNQSSEKDSAQASSKDLEHGNGLTPTKEIKLDPTAKPNPTTNQDSPAGDLDPNAAGQTTPSNMVQGDQPPKP